MHGHADYALRSSVALIADDASPMTTAVGSPKRVIDRLVWQQKNDLIGVASARSVQSARRTRNMPSIYELTEAQCDMVAGGLGGGTNVALFNHNTGSPGSAGPSAGPGKVLHNGQLVSFEVHAVQNGANAFAPGLEFFWAFPFTP